MWVGWRDEPRPMIGTDTSVCAHPSFTTTMGWLAWKKYGYSSRNVYIHPERLVYSSSTNIEYLALVELPTQGMNAYLFLIWQGI